MDKSRRSPEEYLKEPYTRLIIPDEESGFTATILEFPGCVAEGETLDEAYASLERAAASWIEAALYLGQDIPAPAWTGEFSGRVALRLPRGLHRRAAMAAKRDGTSLNQFIAMALAERVGAASVGSIQRPRKVVENQLQSA